MTAEHAVASVTDACLVKILCIGTTTGLVRKRIAVVARLPGFAPISKSEKLPYT